jgi:hypothetical protein
MRSTSSRTVAALAAVLMAVALLVALARSSGPGPGGPPAPAPALLYRDDFSDDAPGSPLPAGWEREEGLWRGVVDDAGRHVVAHAPGPSYGTIVTGSASWGDYSVEAGVKPAGSPQGFAGVVGRYQTHGDFYECVIHHATAVQLWLVHGGRGMELAGRDVAIDPRRFHRLTLSLRGPSITCAIDGGAAATVTDATLRTGRIGLVASDDEPAEFGDVRVAPLNGRPGSALPSPRAPTGNAAPPAAAPAPPGPAPHGPASPRRTGPGAPASGREATPPPPVPRPPLAGAGSITPGRGLRGAPAGPSPAAA